MVEGPDLLSEDIFGTGQSRPLGQNISKWQLEPNAKLQSCTMCTVHANE